MQYALKVEGMAEISEMLTRLEEGAEPVAARAMYKGAAVVADALRKEMNNIRTEPFRYVTGGEKRLPSPEEKEALESAGIGVAKFDRNGVEMNTAVGFNQSGYVNVNFRHMSSQARTNYKGVSLKGRASTASSLLKAMKSKAKGPNQKPVGVIANAINSGTSFMTKQPFVRKAEKAGAREAIRVMKDSIEQDINNMTK